MEQCFQSMRHWLDNSGLCLNSGKSEAIILGTGAVLRQSNGIDVITMHDVNVPVRQSLKSLGATLLPISGTLNDLERRNGPYFALFYRIW